MSLKRKMGQGGHFIHAAKVTEVIEILEIDFFGMTNLRRVIWLQNIVKSIISN